MPLKNALIFILITIVAIGAMIAIAIYIPNNLPAHSDFSALYNVDLALVNGLPIYDLPAVEEIAVKASGLPPGKFFLARFPYPPWYALSTFYLGLLPAKAAATLWFELNLVMLFFSIWFLTDGWDGRGRLVAFPLALLFLPVLGALSVGQYDFPVLLGTSILIYSVRKENIALTLLGTVLLTFKPHIGGLILFAVLIHLIASRNKPALSSIEGFGRRAMRSILIAGVTLFVFGFLADPAWIINYPNMLLNYQGEGNVSSCSECASLPVYLSRWFFDGSLGQATIVAFVLLIVFVVVFYTVRSALLKSHELFLNTALLVTLLVSPYLYNYDFILLLVPFAILISVKGNILQKIGVVLCYLIPTLAIVFYGRDGNVSLILAAIVLTSLLYIRAKNSGIDVPAHAAYNTNN